MSLIDGRLLFFVLLKIGKINKFKWKVLHNNEIFHGILYVKGFNLLALTNMVLER